MTKTDVLDALQLWAPTWPRRVSRRQLWADNPGDTATALTEAERGDDDSPFISVYSFPRGHSSDGNLPRIDTLFIDFDIEDGDYERGSGNREAWKRDLSHLLVRVRQVAREILENENTPAWRAALSGHKGVHLFLDFEPLDTDVGEFEDYIGGLNDYADDLVDELSERTGINDLDRYVDVTSSDLSRLCRVPNTLHGGATNSFGEERYCVPVSIEELESMTPAVYEEFTRSPRSPSVRERSPVSSVSEVIEQHVRLADGRATDYSSTGRQSTLDWGRVNQYEERSNDNLTLEDAKLLTSDMPCVWAFHEREDKFQHGNQSHEMENHCIAKLTESNFPIDVIKEFLSNAPEYDEAYTEQRIRELIARDFNPYTTKKLLQRAPEFCGYSWCARCQRVLEEHDDIQI